jgi:transposase-like protein
MSTFPQTLIEAVRYFSNPDTCHEFMREVKAGGGELTCPKCGGTAIGDIATRRMFQCKTKGCRKQFSTKVGTIFEDSKISLDKWLVAVWCIVNAKNGISSCELARAIGVHQQSAWHMLHRIREAMDESHDTPLDGEIEADESWIGGKRKFMHWRKRQQLQGRGVAGKSCVSGILKRGKDQTSQVRVSVLPNQKKVTLRHNIEQHVRTGITIYTDALKSYRGLDWDYVHEWVDHSIAYVDGLVHTNGMENFWSLLKRTLGGTYVAVAPKHLPRYCQEQAFRFNERKDDDAGRFQSVMRNVVGRKLTYAELTKKDEVLASASA